MWDLFISHAREDKAAVVAPLVDKLKSHRLTVWVDYKELVIGDSLRQRIDEGLAKSRYGLVILSEHFFAKQWPQRELDGLFALERDRSARLLPVWHGISSEIVRLNAPMLAGLLAVKTDGGIQRVAREILGAIRRRDAPTHEDELLEELIAEYDRTVDREDSVRIPRKIFIRDSIMKLSTDVRDVTRYFRHSTEGGRLAFVAVLRQAPRRGELFRLIEVCRLTKHRFVWVEACQAIERYVEVCRTTERERMRAVSELDSLKHRPLFKRSATVREATERLGEVLRGQ